MEVGQDMNALGGEGRQDKTKAQNFVFCKFITGQQNSKPQKEPLFVFYTTY